MKTTLSKLPKTKRTTILRKFAKLILYYGNKRYCPICCKESRCFMSSGEKPRDDAQCPHCGSLERHRLLWIFLKGESDLFEGNRNLLHVAPEPCLESNFVELLGTNYLTADLFNPNVMEKIDICNIQYPEHSFGAIYCSHVLEHVFDDRKAMREFFRVLKPEGWAILNVPIIKEKTFEDPSIVEPKERRKAFGQEDHVRSYGRDYVDRLFDSGFSVRTIRVEDLVSQDESVRMGLTKASGEIYYCTKQHSNGMAKNESNIKRSD